jgi:hypothetical protein
MCSSSLKAWGPCGTQRLPSMQTTPLLSSSSKNQLVPCSPGAACSCALLARVRGAEQGAAPAGLHVQRGHRAPVDGRNRRERERAGLRRAHDAHGVPLRRARRALLRAQRHAARAVLGAGRARRARPCAAHASPCAGKTQLLSTSLGTHACLSPGRALQPDPTRLAGRQAACRHAGRPGCGWKAPQADVPALLLKCTV